MDRNNFPGIFCQDDARWDRMTEEEPVSSRANTRLPDLSTGREVYACSSDSPRKNNLLTLHRPAHSIGSPIKLDGWPALVGP
jgi:hypothetical protein